MQNSKHQEKIINIIDNNGNLQTKLQTICDYLMQAIHHYDWVGFYFKNGSKPELKLAQFAGQPTDHTIIPYGKGICGQVALSNENFIAQDISQESNYISCGFNVKSEIVIPIIINGENIGQIDIDSHTVNPFTNEDTVLLEFVCNEVAKLKILETV